MTKAQIASKVRNRIAVLKNRTRRRLRSRKGSSRCRTGRRRVSLSSPRVTGMFWSTRGSLGSVRLDATRRRRGELERGLLPIPINTKIQRLQPPSQAGASLLSGR